MRVLKVASSNYPIALVGEQLQHPEHISNAGFVFRLQ